jgi:peroxiredoxin Q/BCP
MLKIGDAAPSFALPSTGGTMVRLSDYRGRKVVLYFYPKDQTPGCTREACSFQDALTAMTRKGAVVLGVSTDSVASHEKFRDKYGLRFPLLSDEKREVVKRYGVWKKKSLYGRSFFGIERTTFIIDERGKIARIFPRVKVDGHAQQVLEAISE